MKNIWILTEERPKDTVVKIILARVAADQGFIVTVSDLRVVPIFKDGRFTFVYKAEGVVSTDFGSVYLKLASGNSSFVDFLVFVQEIEPVQNDTPLYAIEETKTDDSESRNTGVYQRLSKFIYVDFFYPGITKIMLYSLSIQQKATPTKTNVFGMRMLKTMGVEVLGKVYETAFEPFHSLDELVAAKNAMRLPPKGNVPIQIEVTPARITISGRLFKSGGIGHDPNIGALTAIASCIRTFEKTKDVVITLHGLEQQHVTKANSKFVQIAGRLRIKLDGLLLPEPVHHESYWHYEDAQEKTATILLDVMLAAYTNAKILYSNHGGTERSYFTARSGEPITIPKYQEGMREAYKGGNKNLIIHIPDVIVYDSAREEIIDVEGKKYSARQKGIEDLKNYDYFDRTFIAPSYAPKKITRTVAVFGSRETVINDKEISFLLNDEGKVVLSSDAPEIFKEAVAAALSRQNV